MSLTASARSIPGTLRQEVVIDRQHRLITDEPQHLGGDGSGPAPHELFPAALAACVSTTLVMYARTKGWDRVRREHRARRRRHRARAGGTRRCNVSRKQIVILGGGTGGTMTRELRPGVDLYWLPLGAGGHSVRLNGRVFEAVAARLQRRPACDLYHSALEVRVPEGRFVIEQAPIADSNGARRGVVAEGAVGSRWAGRFRIFRYEVRRWRDGIIPDVAEAVESPRRLTDDPRRAHRLLALVPTVPTAVWGRDELAAGEMWNSNSLISWLIARSGPGCRVDRAASRWACPGLAGWARGGSASSRASRILTTRS